jgi:murein DD-endopeptidase MepM/ murein hydrolase activator NlpD
LEIIVLTRSGGAGRSLCIVPAALRAVTGAAVLVAGALVWLAFAPGDPPVPDARIQALEAELEQQRRQVAEARTRAEVHLDALAVQLARMEARMIRLDAAGQRLVAQAGLSPEELGFGSDPPGQGGPVPTASRARSVPDFLAEIEALERRIEDREQILDGLDTLLTGHKVRAAVQPAGRPVRKGWLSSYYGMRTDPISGRKAFHDGIDFAGPVGTDVIAVAAGVVTWSGPRAGYGKMVEIAHGNGLATRYAHNSENLVKRGERVDRGQTIARLGKTGRVTGPHVHFEVLEDGRTINPLRFVKAGD